jgi:hypothetical protein
VTGGKILPESHKYINLNFKTKAPALTSKNVDLVPDETEKSFREGVSTEEIAKITSQIAITELSSTIDSNSDSVNPPSMYTNVAVTLTKIPELTTSTEASTSNVKNLEEKSIITKATETSTTLASTTSGLSTTTETAILTESITSSTTRVTKVNAICDHKLESKILNYFLTL